MIILYAISGNTNDLHMTRMVAAIIISFGCYIPVTLFSKSKPKEGAVRLYRQTKDIDFVLRRYHISKASLMRWNKLYDGTRESIHECMFYNMGRLKQTN